MLQLEFLKYSLGIRNTFPFVLNDSDWNDCLIFGQKHSITGVLFTGIEKLHRNKDNYSSFPNDVKLMEWYGYRNIIVSKNSIVNQRVCELTSFFHEGGFRTCVLKGQGNALYYPDPSVRSSGDIDLWVDSGRNRLVNYLTAHNIHIHDIHYVHATADFFNDVIVEIHFHPSWMYNPFSQIRLNRFFKQQAAELFQIDNNVGFSHPSLYFNLVFNVIHINRHIFDEGIGLRHIVDYFYILNASDALLRELAMKQIEVLRLAKFTSALMYVMQTVLDLKDDYLLCNPNEKLGKQLLNDILDGGNFGQFGQYAKKGNENKLIKRGIDSLKRNFQFLFNYPEEVFWIPFFKLGHFFWRKWNRFI